VQTQVTNLADAKIKPLVQSINGELAAIRANEARKAELDKNSAECNKRIAEYQKLIGTAQTEVNELADKLAAATTVAVS
jgi:chromosome segregation ATPase